MNTSRKTAILTAFSLAALGILDGLPAMGFADFPHTQNCGIVCYDCHDLLSTDPAHMPPWAKPDDPVNIEDTQSNNLCWHCHNDIDAPYAETHSSLSTSEKYGDADDDGEPGWAMQCVDCHDPHFQNQLRAYGSETYVSQGTVTSLADTTVTSSGAGWTDDSFKGLVLVPNTLQPNFNYRISGNTSDTITVKDPMDLSAVSAGDTFAVIYGGIIRSQIWTPVSGPKAVKFIRCEGPNSFADGDVVYDGICEVCHTLTEHFQNDGGAPEQLHESIGPGAGSNCCTCHSHSGGFRHGGDCTGCHGHDDGYLGGSYYGSTASHSTHTESDSDDMMGPTLACGDCHDTGNYPFFVSGTDSDGDGRFGLWETDVCDGCHSPGGSYDGIDDPAIGARPNWEDGVYSGFAMRPGREKWCAGCHDESPPTINGVTAPNVVGGESESYTYGTGWGFYRTGHGLPAAETYPSSGGITAGADLSCDDCHDFSSAHVDGEPRTFDDGDSQLADPTLYRQGYRLDLAGGEEPMEIPWPTTYPPGYGTPNGSTVYRLCAGCHDTVPFTDGGNMNTNFVSDGVNRHEYHLNDGLTGNLRYPADWSGAVSSRVTCVACHNVHGSTRLAMVRDGKLTGREPGQQIWYNNDDLVTYSTTNPDPPDPEDLPLSASTGVLWIGTSASNLCSQCHNNGNTVPEYRTPFQDVTVAPVLAWTGEVGYVSDGVSPDSGGNWGSFLFRVSYSDGNNDPPSAIELWIDLNDDGDYGDAGEVVSLTGAVPEDENYFDGKIYAVALSLGKAGDGALSYRFSASDGVNAATGVPTAENEVQVLNNVPLLAWTGEPYYVADGVHPDVGGNGMDFEFRVTYSDADDEAPASVSLWVDLNDDGDYGDTGEQQAMSPAPGGNGAYTDGETYRISLVLTYVGDGDLTYTFRASDGTDSAVDESGPLSDSVVTVLPGANNPPVLDWASADCLTGGVRPAAGGDGADFEFMVSYTDPDNECPGAGDIAVWIDENDSLTYDGGEVHALTEIEAGDTDCTDGKVYAVSLPLFAAGDGDLLYTFSATDGTDSALGEATSDRTVTVESAAKVRPSGGTGWESSIATAVNNNTGLILVYPDAGFSPASYPYTFIMSKPGRTIRAVCGPGLTTVAGVKFQTSNDIEIDGFAVTGATRGIEVLGGSPVRVRNCLIHDNTSSGIYAYNNSSIEVSGCEIYRNGASATQGGGVYINSGSNHSVTHTVVSDNSITGSGGGLFLQNVDGGVTVEDSSVIANGATSGAGVYVNNGNVTILRSVITGNTATNDGGGMYQIGTPSVSLENCVLADNEANRGGAAYVNDEASSTVIVNSTVADNRALDGPTYAGDGGGYYLNCASIEARNSIFWNNAAQGTGHAVFKTGCGTYVSTITSSDVSTGASWITGGAWDFSGNVDPAQDPFFVGGGDYHLQAHSPAIDAADATWAPDDDIDGDPRPQGAADDIGADEYTP